LFRVPEALIKVLARAVVTSDVILAEFIPLQLRIHDGLLFQSSRRSQGRIESRMGRILTFGKI
jgi:hypothetical protein